MAGSSVAPRNDMNETLIRPPLRMAIISGGAAGAHAVAAIKNRDILQQVGYFTGSTNTGGGDLTSEFHIAADGSIDNTGGTDTTGKLIYVLWYAVSAKTDSTT